MKVIYYRSDTPFGTATLLAGYWRQTLYDTYSVWRQFLRTMQWHHLVATWPTSHALEKSSYSLENESISSGSQIWIKSGTCLKFYGFFQATRNCWQTIESFKRSSLSPWTPNFSGRWPNGKIWLDLWKGFASRNCGSIWKKFLPSVFLGLQHGENSGNLDFLNICKFWTYLPQHTIICYTNFNALCASI